MLTEWEILVSVDVSNLNSGGENEDVLALVDDRFDNGWAYGVWR